ncbi:hypothetical protein CIK95_04465 [Prevotella sp. P5-108]|uniref:hypothetical protein n=1 Tax=Prevotella sp. P5-108 TaxID=2024225 RepID=UPI000B95DED8|nr:hypothetical protein [Prevotella sp. P5-108]OYP65586.1 hypothetical protein CIK95_04465 [Prevotella sp. P5-108]
MTAVVGFAFLWLSVTAVGKQVFLLVVASIPNAMLCMTTTAAMVQKAAFGRSKSPPLAVKKQLIVSPSLTLPKGREFVLLVFEEVVVHTFPLGKVGMGLPYGNSVGVAITKPRVEVRSASTLGIYIIRCSYSVRVAISRRRYPQQETRGQSLG